MPQKLPYHNIRISSRALERIAIQFRMIGDNYAASVGMFPLDVVASSVNVYNATIRRCRHYSPAREEG